MQARFLQPRLAASFVSSSVNCWQSIWTWHTTNQSTDTDCITVYFNTPCIRTVWPL